MVVVVLFSPVEIILGFLVDACDFARSKYSTTKITNRTKLQLANALRDEAGIAVDPLRPVNKIKQFGI
jgi:hypothetical protein